MISLPLTQKNRRQRNMVRSFKTLCMVGVATIAFSSFADNTFLLQFGSYNTEEQANQKWEDVKSKNPDIVGKLTPHIAEVALPPDNSVMYRTQAGPISSHDGAAKLCGRLQSRGVDCYVVETALFTSDQPPVAADSIVQQIAAPTLPMASAAAKSDTTAPTPDITAPASGTAAPTTADALTSASNVELMETTVPATPTPPALTQTSPKLDIPLSPEPVVTTATQPMTAPVVTIPAPESTSPAPVSEAPPATAAAPTEVEVADGIFVVGAPGVHPNTDGLVPYKGPAEVAATTPTKETPGFFGRLFGSSDNAAPATTPPAPIIVEPAASAPVVASQIPANVPSQEITPLPLSKSATMDPAIVTTPATPVIASAAEPHVLAPVPTFVPAAPSVEASPTVAQVNVAEAIRVPLGSGKTVRNLPPVHALGGLPSQSSAKTLWAQLNYFADETQARNFYDEFHASYPQFSDGLRVRITRPYTQSAGRVSLRVGPFAVANDVHTICAAATTHGLNCSVIKDLGASSGISTGRARAAYTGQLTRESITPLAPVMDTSAVESSPMYWVQLGSYRVEENAWDEWHNLQEDNKKLLGRIQATVTTPAHSSASVSMFRLRAGPFVGEATANRLCDTLQALGNNCLVIRDR